MPRTRDQSYFNRRYYRAHRDEEIARVRARQKRTHAFLAVFKARPCADCGVQFKPHQMDFDHRDPAQKSFTLSRPTALLASHDRLMAELAKCDVVCANCHRTRTRRQHQARLARRGPSTARSPRIEYHRIRWRADAALLDELRNVPCTDCGGRFPPWVLEFDHRDPSTKRAGVNQLLGHGRARVLAEVALCDIVCATCHRDRSAHMFRWRVSGRE